MTYGDSPFAILYNLAYILEKLLLDDDYRPCYIHAVAILRPLRGI